ncbi:MAG: hypothetical protein NWS85_08710 [Hydrogenophaga sp.]|nr:hypothetical protein [Hydrogenophaga sp.]
MADAAREMQTLRTAFERLRSGELKAHAFTEQAASHSALFAALPPRFKDVWQDLMTRLESGALFDAESCSFSQSDLHESIRLWLDKAAERIAPSAQGSSR